MTADDKKKTQTPKDPQSYLHGFDYLRAFFSVCVVLVHLGCVAPSEIFDREKWKDHVFVLSDAVNFYVLLAAVPVFYLIACFLVAGNSTNAVWPRVFRVMRLMVFWGLLLRLSHGGMHALIGSVPHSPFRFLIYLMSGFHTVYYFFFSLGLAIVTTHAARHLPNYFVYVLCFLTTIFVGLLPILALQFELPQLTYYYVPLNFLPYPFIAIAIERLEGRRAFLSVAILACAGLVLTTLDWTIYKSDLFFNVNTCAMPAYSRPSLILLSVAIVLAATLFSSPANSIVRFMSSHSLALYCLHPFTISAVKGLVIKANLPGLLSLPVQLALVLVLCYMCSAFVLPLFLRKDIYR